VDVESNMDENGGDDTELDQTINLNASYEVLDTMKIKQNSDENNDQKLTNEEDLNEKKEEMVENIIDCSELDNPEEEEDVPENNNVSLFVPPGEQEENDENVTIIIPSELNKINDHVSICVINEPETTTKNIDQAVSFIQNGDHFSNILLNILSFVIFRKSLC
jgi:hypothetical protein